MAFPFVGLRGQEALRRNWDFEQRASDPEHKSGEHAIISNICNLKGTLYCHSPVKTIQRGIPRKGEAESPGSLYKIHLSVFLFSVLCPSTKTLLLTGTSITSCF